MKHMGKEQRIWTIIGILCGLALAAFLIFSITSGSPDFVVGVRDGAVPETAMRATAEATGRNGPVEIEVVADNDQIYQLRVVDEKETLDIGSVAISQLMKAIVKDQTLDVDAVSGATISSDALKSAVGSALSRPASIPRPSARVW